MICFVQKIKHISALVTKMGNESARSQENALSQYAVIKITLLLIFRPSSLLSAEPNCASAKQTKGQIFRLSYRQSATQFLSY